jgi:hypothetical protein
MLFYFRTPCPKRISRKRLDSDRGKGYPFGLDKTKVLGLVIVVITSNYNVEGVRNGSESWY